MKNSRCKVKVKLTGILKSIAKKDALTLNLEKPVTVKSLIFKLTEIFNLEFKRALIDPEINNPSPNALILLNGREINTFPKKLESEVKNGDEIVIIPVTHGG